MHTPRRHVLECRLFGQMWEERRKKKVDDRGRYISVTCKLRENATAVDVRFSAGYCAGRDSALQETFRDILLVAS